MPGEQPDALQPRGTVMQIAISAQARVIKAANIKNEEEQQDG